jgi:hypothetical protein
MKKFTERRFRNKKMKYLRIKIDGKNHYFKAVDNRENKKQRHEPDFKGSDIAVWINEDNPSL